MTPISRRSLLPLAIAISAALAGCNTNDLKPLKLQASSTAVMQGGSGIAINASGGRKSDQVTWRLLPGATGTLTPDTDTRSAIYTPADSGALAAQSIEAKMGNETQTIAVQVQAAPVTELVTPLPAWWQAFPNPTQGTPMIQGEPRSFAPDGNGGHYVAYAAPVSKVVRIRPGTQPEELTGVAGGVIGVAKDGALYLAQSSADGSITVRKRGADGKLTVVTRTAAYDGKKATVDGASGVATADRPALAIDSSGNLFALDGTKVRKIAADGSWSTLAGDGCGSAGAAKCPSEPVPGKGSSARFATPLAFTSDPNGTLYVADNSTLLKVTQAGDVTVVAGGPGASRSVDGGSSEARFRLALSLAADASGNVYWLDDGKVRRIAPSGAVTTVAAGLGAYDPAHPELIAWSLRVNSNGMVEYLRAVDIRRVKVQ